MINKRSLWFLTLFSLILVLSIYYITMPSELLLTTNSNYSEKTSEEDKEETKATVETKESDLLVSLRAESDEAMLKEIEDLKTVLTKSDSTTKEKNDAYNKIQELNDKRSEEEKLENQILEKYELKSFIKINGDNIEVTVDSKKHDTSLANSIMRTIQENYDNSKYISVKFQK